MKGESEDSGPVTILSASECQCCDGDSAPGAAGISVGPRPSCPLPLSLRLPVARRPAGRLLPVPVANLSAALRQVAGPGSLPLAS